MIDFGEMNQRQREGVLLLQTLQEDEKTVLRHYCSLATEYLMREGDRTGAPVDKLVINALRIGIGLGLELQVTGGEVKAREF